MLYPVILAGGIGSRLWPLSRTQHPKQFLAIGDSPLSLFQRTLERVLSFPQRGFVSVIAQDAHRFLVLEQMRSYRDIEDSRIIIEPSQRNTAPAVALAAFACYDENPDAQLLILPADHLIHDVAAFQRSMLQAIPVADANYLVTFGVRPTRPDPGYGYICCATDTLLHGVGQPVQQFFEKPDVARATALLAAGGCSWNSGMFLFRADAYLKALETMAPAIYRSVKMAHQQATIDGHFTRPNPAAWEGCPSDSIDYAVMESCKSVAMVPLASDWCDVGSWDTWAQAYPSDSSGNVAEGAVVMESTQRTFVQATHRLVSTVGVEDLIIVETPDAVLVMDRRQQIGMRPLMATLQKKARPELVQPSQVHRPWGSYEALATGSRYQVKRITVAVQGCLSLQLHHHRSEHWIIVRGSAKVTCGDAIFLLTENQSTAIPMGTLHRLENVGKIPLELIEVQLGSYLGEDDIVRFEDVYGRQNNQQVVTPIT